MSAMLISTKGQVVLPVSVRKALGLKPGMRVEIKLDGKRALLTLATAAEPVSLQQVRALLKYDGPVVPVGAMRVADYKD